MVFAALLMLVASVNDSEWSWIWTTPDYIRSTNTRTWSSQAGTAIIRFTGTHFTAHLENGNHDPAYDIVGNLRGSEVMATAKPTDSDAQARRCSGMIANEAAFQRISLLCDDGEFIGLIRDKR